MDRSLGHTALRRIFGPNGDEATVGERKLYNEEVNSL
jgi:hypothetical protein